MPKKFSGMRRLLIGWFLCDRDGRCREAIRSRHAAENKR
jgi:hypothetical protein